MPILSVIMGVYYHKDDLQPLRRSIESILAQTMVDLELIICDDGSTEEAQKCIDTYASRDSRIVIVRGIYSYRLPEKLNACLRLATGKWIGRMDDDDISHPERFQKQIDYLEGHPDINFVGCNVNLIQNEKIIGKRMFPEFPTVKDFYFVQPFIHPTLVFQKSILDAVNGYSEDRYCVLCEDYDLLLRLYAHGYRGANLQDTFFDYTISNNAKGSRKMSHRINEVVTRYRRFRDLKCLPHALPYVVKPIIVGIIPEKILKSLKRWYY